MNFCSHCGAKIIDPNSRFCAVCGGKLALDMPLDAALSASPTTGLVEDVAQPTLHISPDRILTPATPAEKPLENTENAEDLYSSPFVKDTYSSAPRSGEGFTFAAEMKQEAAPKTVATQPSAQRMAYAPTQTSSALEASEPMQEKTPTSDAFSLVDALLAESAAKKKAAAEKELSTDALSQPVPTAPTATKTPARSASAGTMHPTTQHIPSQNTTQADLFAQEAAPPAAEKPNLFAQEAAPPAAEKPNLFAQEATPPAAEKPNLFAQEATPPAAEKPNLFAQEATPPTAEKPNLFAQEATPPTAEKPNLFAQEATPPAAEKPNLFAQEATLPAAENPNLFAQEATPPAAENPNLFAQEAAPSAAAPLDLFAQEASPAASTQEIPAAPSAPPSSARHNIARPHTHGASAPQPHTVPAQRIAQPKPPAQPQKMSATPVSNIPPPVSAHNAPVMDRRSQSIDSYDDFSFEETNRKKGHIVRNVLIGVLAGLLVLLLAVLGFLYWQNRPTPVIDDFTTALAARDYQSMSESVTATGVTASGAEGWVALCDAFESEEARAALSQELSRVSANADTSGFLYPSVRLKGDPLFLFINQYHVRLTGVSVLVPNAAEGTSLRLSAGNEFQDFTGTADASGMLFTGIMPGLYSATVTLPDGTVQEGTVSAFSVAQPNVVDFGTESATTDTQAGTYANLTIQNCISDDAQIMLNGQLTPAVPVSGVVQLQEVELGSTISIEAQVDGTTQSASVTFSDPNQTTLSFSNYTQTGEAASEAGTASQTLSEADANAALVTFYQSYLEAINQQSLTGIQLSTEANNGNLQARITSTANQANTYTYVSAAVDPATLTVEDVDGVPTAEFTASCSFSYVARENPGEPQTSTNTQAVRMIYQNGTWLVDSFTNV